MDKDKHTNALKGYMVEVHVKDHWGSRSSYSVHRELLAADSKLVQDALREDEDLADITLKTVPFLGVEAIEAYLFWLYRDTDIKVVVDNEESIQEHADKDTCRVRAIRDLYIAGCAVGSKTFKNAIMDQFTSDMLNETLMTFPRTEFRTFFESLRYYDHAPILHCLVILVYHEIESCKPEIAEQIAQSNSTDPQNQEYISRGWLEITNRTVAGGIIKNAFIHWHNDARRISRPPLSPAEHAFYESYGDCFFHCHDHGDEKCPPKPRQPPTINQGLRDTHTETDREDSSTVRENTPFSPEAESMDDEMAEGDEMESEDCTTERADATPVSSPVERVLPYRPMSIDEY